MEAAAQVASAASLLLSRTTGGSRLRQYRMSMAAPSPRASCESSNLHSMGGAEVALVSDCAGMACLWKSIEVGRPGMPT